MTLRAIIIDDEQGSRKTLSLLLQEYCPAIDLVATAHSVESGREAIAEHHPHLVFLDIQMPFGNGFELLERIPEQQFEVIFTTAYDQYAVRAFKVSALDYLLKPIDADDLMQAVQRAEEKVREPLSHRSLLAGAKPDGDMKEQMALLLRTLSGELSVEKVALPTADGIEFIQVQSIVRCEAVANYTRLHCIEHEPMLITRTLKEFDRVFTGSNFYRVHNSHLINLDHVVRYVRSDGGQVVMADGSAVDISRRKRDELLDILNSRAHRMG